MLVGIAGYDDLKLFFVHLIIEGSEEASARMKAREPLIRSRGPFIQI